MNGSDELERLLGQQLHQQVDGMTDAPIGLGDVKGRAGRIRRNRRIAGGAVVAAVLAVAVPTALAVGPDLTRSDQQVPPANPDNGPTRSVLTLDGLETGASPLIEYFDEQGVVLPTQGPVDLDRSYQGLIENPAGGGWLAVEPSRDELRDLTADFQRTSGRNITQSVVTTPDRDHVAFVSGEAGAQTLVVWDLNDAEGGRTWNLPELPVASPVGFLADDRVVYETTDDTGRVAIGVAEPGGTTTAFGPDYLRAIDANPENGLVTVQTAATDSGGCFAVADPAQGGRPVWKTCDYSLGLFSPDGTYVLASDAYQSGDGKPSLSVLDARTGDLVASFQPEDPRDRTPLVLRQVAWEDDDSVVAVATKGTDAAVLRLGVDGSLVQAVATAPIVGDTPYYLGMDRTHNW